MGSLECQCCFCGQGIERGGGVDGKLDPCAVVVVGYWQEEGSQQLEQQFFCHLECFKAKMHDSSYMALETMVPGEQA